MFLKSDEMNLRYKLGTMSDDEFWTWAAKEWKVNLSPGELQALLIEGYTVNPEVEKLVKTTRQHGYKTLICSNNFPARVNGLQKRFGFLDNFDAAVFSHELGATKPSEAIFIELVKRSGVSADSIVFADDVDRLSGAKALGIVTFVYEGLDSYLKQLKKLGVEL